MAEHTPGPWELNPLTNPNNPRYYCVYVKPGGPETVEHICQVNQEDGPNWKANAHLIAAAPDLRASLDAAMTEADENYNQGFPLPGWYEEAADAIAKTEPEPVKPPRECDDDGPCDGCGDCKD